MDKIWSVDGGSKSTEAQPSVTPAPSQLLLKGQTLIGQNGRLTKANCAQGELARKKKKYMHALFRHLLMRHIWYLQYTHCSCRIFHIKSLVSQCHRRGALLRSKSTTSVS